MKTKYSLSMFKEQKFNAVRSLTFEEFEKYSKFILRLVNIRNEENLFKIVELNYLDLISRIESSTKRFETEGLLTEEQEYLHLEINRLILNLLSSIRTYLDHTETRLKRSPGQDSEDYQLFKKETNTAYDNNFEYRFLYKLRNYSQHCGLPAGALTAYSSNDNTPQYQLILNLLRDELLRNFDWGNPITKELREKAEQFDILSLIKTKFVLLESINDKVKILSYKHHKTEGYALLDLLTQIDNKDGAPCLLSDTPMGNKTNLSILWFPFSAITYITGVKLY
jgi:hypothetical protein